MQSTPGPPPVRLGIGGRSPIALLFTLSQWRGCCWRRWGVIAYLVAERMHESGAGLALSRVLSAVFEGVRVQPPVLGIAVTALMAVAVSATWFQVRSAVARGPIGSLRDG